MKKVVLLFLCVALVLSVAACKQAAPAAPAPAPAEAAPAPVAEAPQSAPEAPAAKDPADITIAVIPKALDNSVFLDAKVAAEAKGKELGIKVEWVASVASVASEQVSVIEGLIEKGVDGMLISCNDADALKDVIDRAVDAGIVVATFDSDSPDSKRAFYIGSYNYGLGVKCAEYVTELLPDGGKIAVLTGVPGVSNLEERIQGLRDNIKDNIEILPIQACDDDAQKSVEVVNQFTNANPEMDGWVFVGGWPFLTDPNSLPELKKFMEAGKVCISVDSFYPMLQFIQLDMTQVLIGQNFSLMGSQGVQEIYDIITTGNKPADPIINTDAEIITKDNVEDILKTKTPW